MGIVKKKKERKGRGMFIKVENIMIEKMDKKVKLRKSREKK